MYNLPQDDATVEEVLEGFDKVINDASTVSGGRKTSSVGSDNSKRYRKYPDMDDMVIIPTRIVPEPPRRSRSLFVNKNFEVNPFFEDDEESVDSECAYEEEEEEDDDDKSKLKRSETFHSVQKQIKRFSALAVHNGRTETEAKVKDEGRRKSIYNVFGNVNEPTRSGYNNVRPVTRSASTRNVNDPSRIPVVKFDHCKSERSVYLPMGCGDAAKEPKVFMTRGHNNAGLYSGYKDTVAAAVGVIEPSTKSSKLSSSNGSSNGLKALQHINMSVSTGKLTDFPSGLY